MSSKRVIIQKKPYRNHAIGDSVSLPSRVADQKIDAGLARVFGAEDWARQQVGEKEAAAERVKTKAAKKAQQKKHHDENEALRPLVKAKDALSLIERRLLSAEKRLEGASGKKHKEWAKTVRVIKAEQKAAREAVAKLGGAEPEPEPGDSEPGGEGDPPKIEMS